MVHCLVIIVLVVFSDLFYQRQLLYLITFKEVCQQLFLFFLKSFFSRFFSGALGVNTGNPCRFKVFCRCFSAANINITQWITEVNGFFQVFSKFFYKATYPHLFLTFSFYLCTFSHVFPPKGFSFLMCEATKNLTSYWPVRFQSNITICFKNSFYFFTFTFFVLDHSE